MSTNDGGPAFPQDEQVDAQLFDELGFARTKAVFVVRGGMTLRDYFAAKAMAAFTSDIGRVRTLHESAAVHGITFGAEVAAQAYDMADAMLAERAKARE